MVDGRPTNDPEKSFTGDEIVDWQKNNCVLQLTFALQSGLVWEKETVNRNRSVDLEKLISNRVHFPSTLNQNKQLDFLFSVLQPRVDLNTRTHTVTYSHPHKTVQRNESLARLRTKMLFCLYLCFHDSVVRVRGFFA